jgi:hypothetical protein
MWYLYICILSASGGCVSEKLLSYASETSCKSALAGARVEAGVKPPEGAKVTSLEITTVGNQQVLMLCRPK